MKIEEVGAIAEWPDEFFVSVFIDEDGTLWGDVGADQSGAERCLNDRLDDTGVPRVEGDYKHFKITL